MSSFKHKFERIEQKYLLTAAQLTAFSQTLETHFSPDEYGESRICNIYYDTPDYRLIRTSCDKPEYKEKLRLRTYGQPTADSTAFVEIKKKYRGVVYKRRVDMRYSEAMAYLGGIAPPPRPSQITSEIDWMRHIYPGLREAMMIAYDRRAFFANDDPELRITLDKSIQWRTDRLTLTAATDGSLLLPPDICLMEIKLPLSMPLWLSHRLCESNILPTSFSKYGEAYKALLSGERQKSFLTA